DLLRDAERERIAKRTLERAKVRLGVNVRRVGFGPDSRFMWALPHCAPSDVAGNGAGGLGGQWHGTTAATENGVQRNIGRHTQRVASNGQGPDTLELRLEATRDEE